MRKHLHHNLLINTNPSDANISYEKDILIGFIVFSNIQRMDLFYKCH